MDSVIWANNALTTLASNITTSQTTIALTSGSGALFPNPGAGQFFPITLISATNNAVFEIVYCTARSGDTCTVIRAQEATTGKAFNAGDLAQNLITAGTILPPGRLLNIQGLFASGTYTETPGTTRAIGYMLGGGGAGGGAPATGSGQVSCGGGGGSGALCWFQVLNPTASTVVIGAGGVGASGSVGGNGGSSSFGGIFTAAGGAAGAVGGPSSAGFIAQNGAGGAIGSTANILDAGGNPGTTGITLGIAPLGGTGGASPLFAGAGFGSSGLSGGNATAPGAGGGGSSNVFNAAAQAGASGGAGCLIVWEYS